VKEIESKSSYQLAQHQELLRQQTVRLEVLQKQILSATQRENDLKIEQLEVDFKLKNLVCIVYILVKLVAFF